MFFEKGSHCVAMAGLELRDPSAYLQVLGLRCVPLWLTRSASKVTHSNQVGPTVRPYKSANTLYSLNTSDETNKSVLVRSSKGVL